MVTELLYEYRYWFLFLGLLVAGETVLVPGIYFAMTGVFDYGPLITIAILATYLSDSVLYCCGRFLPWSRLSSSRLFARRTGILRTVFEVFSRDRLKYLFLSRFVYGTRSVAQVFCGATRLSYWRYAAVNLSGAAVWLCLILIIALAAGKSLEALKVQVYRAQFALGFLVLLLVLFQIWIRKWIKKQRSPPSSLPTTKEPPSEASFDRLKGIL